MTKEERKEVEIKDFYEHDVLVAMTKELTDQLRRNRTVDWQFRDDAGRTCGCSSSGF